MNDLREAAKKEHFCGFPKEVQVKRMRQIEENMILKNMMWMIGLKILLVNVSWHWMANLHTFGLYNGSLLYSCLINFRYVKVLVWMTRMNDKTMSKT